MTVPFQSMNTAPAPQSNMPITASLEQLQTEEQRLVLATIAQIRRYGLDGILSLPQIVVCGDQSSGKSSVLEALIGIPFSRNGNLCTRFAEQAVIEQFKQSISDFSELPRVMNLAMTVTGLNPDETSTSPSRAFAQDVLSIEIEGPSRPQLTLVDVPGLV